MLAPGRALPGVEQSWGGRGPAPRRAPFCCEVKDGGWDFPVLSACGRLPAFAEHRCGTTRGPSPPSPASLGGLSPRSVQCGRDTGPCCHLQRGQMQ